MLDLAARLDLRVGDTATYISPDEFGMAGGRYFARAIGDTNPLYFEGAATVTPGVPGPILPPTLLFETNQYTDLPLDEAGGSGHLWFDDMPGVRLVRGGNSYHWFRDVLPTDRVTVTLTVTEVTHSKTRDGSPMHVLTHHITYSAADGERIAEQDESQILIEVGA